MDGVLLEWEVPYCTYTWRLVEHKLPALNLHHWQKGIIIEREITLKVCFVQLRHSATNAVKKKENVPISFLPFQPSCPNKVKVSK